jgi:hypothetical protein
MFYVTEVSSNDRILLANPEIGFNCAIKEFLVDSTTINNTTCMAGVDVCSDVYHEAFFRLI